MKDYYNQYDPLDPLNQLVKLYYYIHNNNDTFNAIINILSLVLITWLIIEILFYFTLRLLVWPKLQAFRKTQPYDKDPLQLVMSILNLIDFVNDSYSFQKFASGIYIYNIIS